MTVESVINVMKNTQDIQLLGNLNEIVPYVREIIRLLISNIALRGIPFMAGF